MPTTITLNHTLDDQFLSDVLTTAVESDGHALWYWEGFIIGDVERAISREPDPTTRTMVEVMVGDAEEEHGTILGHLSVYRVTFTVDHPQDGDDYQIDLEDVAKGIQWILDGTVPVADRLVSMIHRAVADEYPDIDAEGADVIMQAACFKELVFG